MRNPNVRAMSYIIGQGVRLINSMHDITCASSTKEDAIASGDIIDRTIKESGLVLAVHKSVNACQSMTFLRILFNSKDMMMSVTPVHMDEIREELDQWKCFKKVATKKEIQPLVGKLQFIAKCCKPGRCFLSRMFAALKRLRRPCYKIHLNSEFRKDIEW